MNRKGNILLWPFSLLYGALTGFRNFLYNSDALQSVEFDIPIICVGNITVGGTGKTPHCEYLINLLSGKYNIALLSRGYKRKKGGFRIVNGGMSVSETGDEPMQIFRKFPGVVVAVDSNRRHGIRTLLKEKPETEVILLDDGFQHRSIRPGLTLLLTDFSRLMIHDKMLPYGDLREDVKNIYRADIILITKSPADLPAIDRRIIVKEFEKAPWQNLYFTAYHYGEAVPLFSGNNPVAAVQKENSQNAGAVLVTGIANPETFVAFTSSYATEIIHLSFPDHHVFTQNDIARITMAFDSLKKENRYIITTEKDSVRLMHADSIPAQVKSSIFYFPVEVFFLNDDSNEFDNHILEYVRTNKRNSRVP